MLTTVLIVLAGSQATAADPAETSASIFARHAALTSVSVRCPERATADEVVVCGRRRADRYRVPLEVAPDPGDPRHEGVPAERQRLIAKRDNCAEKSAFLIGCGMVGASMTVDGRGTRVQAARPLSP